MKTESTKKDFIAYMGALHGTKWMNASYTKRYYIWQDAMVLRKACAKKTWVFTKEDSLLIDLNKRSS